MQSSLLKRISAFRSKEELLEFVACYHMLLDPINLVTCLYRLAKMSFSQRSRSVYLQELQRSATFQLLLRSISSQFLHAQLLHMQHQADPKGVDARCLANLVWALAKLDLSSDEAALSTEIALNVAPFVLRCLGGSSPQGLANMLWSYAKLPVAPPDVVAALLSKITAELGASLRAGGDDAKPFDAQALSNSAWALAHLKSRGAELESYGGIAVAFLEAVAAAASRMLAHLQPQLLALPRPPGGGAGGCGGAPDAAQLLAAAEADFSCQALVNICWALATIAGPACGAHPPFRQLFSLFSVVNSEAVGRLRATAALLRARRPLPYHGAGGFNEQALSNAVYAFDKAGLLQTELLTAIFEVATLRLQINSGAGAGADGGAALGFKPQELCTLLKACHTGVAPPWAFLSALLDLLAARPAAVDGWGLAEKAELQRAYVLYSQQQQQQHAAAAAAASAAAQRVFGGGAGEAALLAGLGLLGAQQQQEQHTAAAAAAAQQQQALAAAVAVFERQQALQQAQHQQQVVSAVAGAQQLAAAQRPGPHQRAPAGAGAAARPPPAPTPAFGAVHAYGGTSAPFGGRGGAGAQPGMPLSTALFEAPLLGGAPPAAASPPSPSPRATAPSGLPPAAPGVDRASNKQQRARLAHAPQQQQMLLYAQTQQWLADEGLATSTAGSLGGGSASSGGWGGGAGEGGGGGAVDGAALRPWLLEAAAAMPLGGARA
ncbi:hypothetical protein MNEG_8495 [Monoraphidium neglectum]|uniref:Uncharacterized protein n=1 Tax=Monoraphidium neglectum TaxID=145388 RepID=A0A0D2M7Y5_9CHLO|nr:hypothetical protein MNEG_8495 [Monoraphidium neglectum]KIY99464.1 hypothetical protein MNEG_8495 [Monoraphidium neglectum]|eukprot:XP_013898484.1 hypothetical protein MNEG_8495 [Monoraphidium neglectum]